MLKPAHLTAEKELLNIIINNKDIYQSIKDKFKPEDFLEPIYRKLAEIAYDAYEINEELDGIEVVDEFDANHFKSIIEKFNLIKVTKQEIFKELIIDDLVLISYDENFKLTVKELSLIESANLRFPERE